MPRVTIPRTARLAEVRTGLARAPVVALLGPRQCGKTTLARELSENADQFYDLERSVDRQTLAAAPERVLGAARGLVVLDEVQTMPNLLPVLRVLADRPHAPAQFLLLGSASPDLIQGASESLAGRVAFVYLSGFDISEAGAETMERLWWRGGFPRSFLASDDGASSAWRLDFIETFLSRDAARFGINLPPEGLRRFWTMLAHLDKSHEGRLGGPWPREAVRGLPGLAVFRSRRPDHCAAADSAA